VSGFREPGFSDRQKAAQEARKNLLNKFKSQPGLDDPAVAARRAEREALAAKRAEAKAAREAEKAEQKRIAEEAAAAEAARIAREAEEAIAKLTTAMVVNLDRTQHTPEVIGQLKPVLHQHKGNCELYVKLLDGQDRKVTLRLAKENFVTPSQETIDAMEQLLGSGCVEVAGEGNKRIRRLEQQRLFKEQQAEVPTAADSEDAAVAEMDLAMA